MVYLEKYDPAHTYMSPAGTIMDTAAVREQFPASAYFSHVVQTDAQRQMMYAFQNLAAMRTQYGIDGALGEDAAVSAIQDAMNAEASAVPEPSAEERIAAAMEFQNAINL